MNPMDLLLGLGLVCIWCSIGVLTNEFIYARIRKRGELHKYSSDRGTMGALLLGPVMLPLAFIHIMWYEGKDG